MAYLGWHSRPDTWKVGCDGCGRLVKGGEPPKIWETDTDPIPMTHYCPRCRRKRAHLSSLRGIPFKKVLAKQMKDPEFAQEFRKARGARRAKRRNQR